MDDFRMTFSRDQMDISLAILHQQYAQAVLLPSDCVIKVLARMLRIDRPEIWITRLPDEQILEQARKLDRMLLEQGASILQSMPLFGIPFAVKDNIDVAGLPTTAACPDFAYTPTASAFVVDKLLAAGAILIGKTNLDQFATGLVGARSPYGTVRNALHPEYVSGGSSSGSAVAVALGLVAFSLGTDTAGSGRVPAGFNNVVGLKPTPGLLSTRGVFPACRSLDCVSIFANTVQDAWAVTRVAAGYDDDESYSRKIAMLGVKRRGYRIAVPAQLEFYGDTAAQSAFAQTLAALKALPNCVVETVDYAPFQEAAGLLYQGPWVAERLAAAGKFFYDKRASIHPVVASIIEQGEHFNAVDAFNAQYRLADLKRQAERTLSAYDFMIVPTTPTIPTIAAVEDEPVKRNAELGFYTNFVNFFNMAALAIPAFARADGLPAGITLIGVSGADHRLAAAAQALQSLWQKDSAASSTIAALPLPFSEPTIQLAVVGAHLTEQPLNWQLIERGAAYVETTKTSAFYSLHALAGAIPAKPALRRVASGGNAIEVEIWEVPLRTFGEIVADVPPPLAIGSLELADGRWIKGFICEPIAFSEAVDITQHGGWRAFLRSRLPSNQT
jgi:allophanate hydrolase